jgi:membrane protease YdiL (CAAX protease family)
MEKKSLKIKHSLSIFVLCLITLGGLAFMLQEAFGLYGLAVTEILILGFAILPLYFFKDSLKEIFKFKKPKLSHIIGSIILWLGTYLLVILVTQVTLYFFGEGFNELSDEMKGFFTSVPLPLALIIVAVLPAVCEELLHRGLIQYTFRTFDHWKIVLIMGIIFGFFHLDPYRFLPTAILGALLTYTMLETKNILIPMLIHFINNALAVVLSFQNIENNLVQSFSKSQQVISIGSLLLLAAIVPFIFLVGIKLIRGKVFKAFKIKRVLYLSLVSLLIFLSGFGVLMTVEMDRIYKPIFETNFEGSFSSNQPHEFTFEVEESKDYDYDLAIDIEKGLAEFYIKDSKGHVIIGFTAEYMTGNGREYLKADQYTLGLVPKIDLENGELFDLMFRIKIK